MEQHKLGTDIDDLRRLMAERLGVRGPTLEAQLRRAGRLLPQRLRRAGRTLVSVEQVLAHPKLSRRVPTVDARLAARDLREYLEGKSATDRRVGKALGFLGTVSFNLLAVAALVMVVVLWRGLT